MHLPMVDAIIATGLPPSKALVRLKTWNSIACRMEMENGGRFVQVLSKFYPKVHARFPSARTPRDLFLKFFPTPVCSECGETIPRSKGMAVTCSSACTYHAKTGFWNPSQNPEVKRLKEQTTLANYGVKNPFQSPTLVEKSQETRYAKTGYRHALQNPSVSALAEQKRVKTTLARHGVRNVFQLDAVKEQIVNTNLEKIGVEHPAQNSAIMATILKTREQRCIAEHGVSHLLQTDHGLTNHQRACKATKTFKHKGVRYEVQSSYEAWFYERFVDKYGWDSVFTQFQKGFPMETLKNIGTRPDLYLEETNTFIEVKSWFTLAYTQRMLSANKKKAKQASRAGYRLKWVVLSDVKGGVFTVLPKTWYEMTMKELKNYIRYNSVTKCPGRVPKKA